MFYKWFIWQIQSLELDAALLNKATSRILNIYVSIVWRKWALKVWR